MIKKYTLVATVIILLACISNACKKYEDGPVLSLRTKKARLTGDWSINSVTVNGVDVTEQFNRPSLLLPANTPEFRFVFKKNGRYEQIGKTPGTGAWKFNKNKEDLIIIPDQTKRETSYSIQRLAEKDFWFKSVSPGRELFVKYIKDIKL